MRRRNEAGTFRLVVTGVIVLALGASSSFGQTRAGQAGPGPVSGPEEVQSARQVLNVLDVLPTPHSRAAPTATITVRFDRPLRPGTIHPGTFRVFGNRSGPIAGTRTLSANRRTVTFTPASPFAAGETVRVNLSNDITSVRLAQLRRAGYAFRFKVTAAPATRTFTEIASMSNVTGQATQIYGATACDLNGDGFADLATVNEDTADVRVTLSLANGMGTYGAFLAPVAIGDDASPNEAADFDNDGNTDLCVAATGTDSVWILLGAGDGTFDSVQSVAVGQLPHGVVTVDADGDGDLDVVNANVESNDLSLLLNDGQGGFTLDGFFEGGVGGEYGLAAGDMDGNGITDLVVSGVNGQELGVLFGTGHGSFVPEGTTQGTGGRTWVVELADVNGDGHLDAGTANSSSDNASILLGNGDGTFGTATTINLGAFMVSVDFGDLDGDDDEDLVLSCFGGGFWRIYTNDGTGAFSFDEQINAPDNPSCAVLYDADNDGDLDMALTDEVADVVLIQRND